uniref:Uncharacterized protein n=1 Tax=Meloidogyne enterolobii TaxID=390850 RepID=A0A6V7UG51_MELEN|nr:unnamed protein product [Meloidogyne enterolobii]
MVQSNYIDSFVHIAKGIYKLQIDIPPSERELISTFEQSYYGQYFNMTESNDLIGIIVQFLNCKCVKAACSRLMEFYVPDNTTYLLSQVSRIIHPEYSPSLDDIIRARASTKGIYEIIFSFRQFTIRLIDVGGQKTERRKWIHCFEGVTAILFIVSLACYNNVLEEDANINQMTDTKDLFKQIYRNKFLRPSSLIMFLNKMDIFAEKLKYAPLENFYPEFKKELTEEMTDEELFDVAIDFVKSLFSKIKGNDRRPLYMHTTNATDTRNVEVVFNAAYDTAVTKNLKNSGVL